MGRAAWNLIVALALVPGGAACGLEVDFSRARFACATSADCPDGQECSAGYCAANGIGGDGQDDSAAPDGAPGQATSSPDGAASTDLLVFVAVRDAYVDSAQPDANRGAGDELLADGTPPVITYVHFHQAGLDDIAELRDVQSVTLEIYAHSAHATGFRVSVVEEPMGWSESTLTFNNAPPFNDPVGSSGPLVAGAWTSVDLGVPGPDEDLESFAITTDAETGLSLASRESGDLAPRLVYRVAAE